uniref:Uncharacterized protein n=1 Tax=Rhizophora mucronata TaxID=61149 RepID=A0A2P2NUT7_RHIMU
MPFFSEHFNCT